MNTCTHCNETKSESKFYSNSNGVGVDYYCIPCRLESTAASRKRRARRGPPCGNCGERYVYYAKGLCGPCYVYKQRTGQDRRTDNDYTKTMIGWMFDIIDGSSVEDLACASKYCEETIRAALAGRLESPHWEQAYALLPEEMQKKVKHAINGRLRPRDVREIRELSARGLKQIEIGKMYGRTYSSISRIVNGSRYGHIT